MEDDTLDDCLNPIEQLKKCDELLEECGMILDSLEYRLENTPKPSELLGWSY